MRRRRDIGSPRRSASSGPLVLIAAFGLACAIFAAMVSASPDDAVPADGTSAGCRSGDLQIDAAFQLDQLSMTLVLVITGVGALIHSSASATCGDDPGYPRYFAYLNLFVFFMLVLVLGAKLPMMFVGWEGVGLCSYLLIGFWFSDRANANAGKKAFIVNRIGDFGFLIAMFILFANLGTLDYTRAAGRRPRASKRRRRSSPDLSLPLLGCAGKSAQIPLYVWLPDAMAGPTPVSALIHAATMVTAGVYLVARSVHAVRAGARGRPHRLRDRAVSRRSSPRRSASSSGTSRRCWPTLRSRSWATCSSPSARGRMSPGSSTSSRTPSSRRSCSSAPGP